MAVAANRFIFVLFIIVLSIQSTMMEILPHVGGRDLQFFRCSDLVDLVVRLRTSVIPDSAAAEFENLLGKPIPLHRDLYRANQSSRP